MVTIALPGNLLDLLDGPEPSTEPAPETVEPKIHIAAETKSLFSNDGSIDIQVPWEVVHSDESDDDEPETLGEMVSTAATEIVENVDQIVANVVPEMETDAGATAVEIPVGDATVEATATDEPADPPVVHIQVGPTDPPPHEPTSSELRFLREKQEYEHLIASLSVEIAQHKATAKALKESLDATIENYEKHISRGPEQYNDQAKNASNVVATFKSMDHQVAVDIVATTDSDNKTTHSAFIADKHTAPPANPDAWRQTPTSELDFDSIKGMGKKKIESLLERCPTMGDLTDLVEKNEFGKGLTTIKGIGGVLASDIENAMSDWLTKNRDAEILGFAGMTAQEQVELTKQQDATASADVVSNQTTATAAASPAQQSPAQPADAIQARFDDLADSTDENRFDPHYDMDAWTAGQNSYIAGAHFRQCPLPAGPRQDDWLRGWLAEQEAESGIESGDVVSDDDEQDYENSTGEDGEYFDEDEDGE